MKNSNKNQLKQNFEYTAFAKTFIIGSDYSINFFLCYFEDQEFVFFSFLIIILTGLLNKLCNQKIGISLSEEDFHSIDD